MTDGQSKILKDILGNPANVGDNVAVAMLYGRSATMRLGQIIDITETYGYDQQVSGWKVKVQWTVSLTEEEAKRRDEYEKRTGRPYSYGDPEISTFKVETGYSRPRFMII